MGNSTASPIFARNKLSKAVALACITLAATPIVTPVEDAAADLCTVASTTIGATVNTTDSCFLGAGESLTVTNTGKLLVFPWPTATAPAVNVTGGVTAGSVSNSGTIAGTYPGIGLSSASTLGSVTNSGTIAGWTAGIGMVSSSTITGAITNTGTISGFAGTGILAQSGNTIGSITNSGAIVGLGGDGIHLGGSSNITGALTNNAGGVIFGTGTGISLTNGSSIGSIVNSGTISGPNTGIYLSSSSITGGITNNTGGVIFGSSIAINLESGSTVSNITNSGTISGSSTGIRVDSTSQITGAITNNSGGLIYGTSAIRVLSGSTVGSVINSGTISGAYAIDIEDPGSSIGTLTNNSGGLLYGSVTAVYMTGGATIGNLNNSGTISGSYAIYMTSSHITGALTNNSGGLIYGSSTAIDMATGSTIGSISNSGTISGDYAIFVGSTSSITGAINNSGLIRGMNGAGTYGTAIGLDTNSTIGSITNSGTISGYYGIWVGSGSDITGGIDNSGTIKGVATAIAAGWNSFGTTGSISGGITNSGTISGSKGVALYNATLSNGITNNGGTISGTQTGILVTSTSTLNGGITNSGTISGTNFSVKVDAGSTLANIDITGTGARFIGDVSAPTTDVTVKSGAVFSNDSAFLVQSFTVENGGTFNIGADPQVSVSNDGIVGVAAGATATITGNYTQTANGVFQTGASSASNYGKLVVSGTADMTASGAIDVNVSASNTLASGEQLTDVLSAGTLNAGALTVTDNSVLLDFTAAIDGNTIDLTTITAATPVAPTTPTTPPSIVSIMIAENVPGGIGAATALDALLASGATGDMATIIGELTAMSTQQEIANAVEQMIPAHTAAVAQMSHQSLVGVINIIKARLERIQGLSAGDATLADRRFWVKPYATRTDQDDRKGVRGYDGDSWGIIFGADGELDNGWRVGAALGYNENDTDSNSAVSKQNVDAETWQVSLYGSYDFDERTNLLMEGIVGHTEYDSDRSIVFGGVNRVASADYDGWQFAFNAVLERSYSMSDKTTISPSLWVDYAYADVDSYTEKGAGALNLAVRSDDADAFIVGVGVKLDHQPSDNSLITANLDVGHDFQADRNSLQSTFTGGGPAFVTRGFRPDETVYKAGVGFEYQTESLMNINVRYDVQGRDDYDDQAVSANLRWKF